MRDGFAFLRDSLSISFVIKLFSFSAEIQISEPISGNRVAYRQVTIIFPAFVSLKANNFHINVKLPSY